MRERVYLASGTLEIETGPLGTLVRAVLAARNRPRRGTATDGAVLSVVPRGS